MIRSLLAILTACVLLNGQPHLITEFQNNENVVLKQLFESPDPVEQAWAAYLAGGHKSTKWVPEIRGLLGSADSFVTLAALDALIQLNADVPFDELIRKVPRYRVHMIILLAKRPKENRDALS